MMPIIASVPTMGAKRCEALGKSGRQKRIMPYVPIFRSTPASITEPAVGASTCASGSQVWNGKSGTLMAKPAKRSMKIKICGLNQNDPSPNSRVKNRGMKTNGCHEDDGSWDHSPHVWAVFHSVQWICFKPSV